MRGGAGDRDGGANEEGFRLDIPDVLLYQYRRSSRNLAISNARGSSMLPSSASHLRTFHHCHGQDDPPISFPLPSAPLPPSLVTRFAPHV
jgi:hypothetical protein